MDTIKHDAAGVADWDKIIQLARDAERTLWEKEKLEAPKRLADLKVRISGSNLSEASKDRISRAQEVALPESPQPIHSAVWSCGPDQAYALCTRQLELQLGNLFAESLAGYKLNIDWNYPAGKMCLTSPAHAVAYVEVTNLPVPTI